MKLTRAQTEMLKRLAEHGSERTPFTGGRRAGIVASGWYRTAAALIRLGLVSREREGDAWRIRLAAKEGT